MKKPGKLISTTQSERTNDTRPCVLGGYDHDDGEQRLLSSFEVQQSISITFVQPYNPSIDA